MLFKYRNDFETAQGKVLTGAYVSHPNHTTPVIPFPLRKIRIRDDLLRHVRLRQGHASRVNVS